MTTLSQNINGLNFHFAEPHLLKTRHKIDYICLQETYLSPTKNPINKRIHFANNIIYRQLLVSISTRMTFVQQNLFITDIVLTSLIAGTFIMCSVVTNGEHDPIFCRWRCIHIFRCRINSNTFLHIHFLRTFTLNF